MILYSSGTLPFFETLAEQHRAKQYAYGKRAPISVGLNKIPPFQIVVPLAMPDINSVIVIKEADGIETERYSVMSPLGFETRSFPTYKIIVWPGLASIPTVSGGGLLDMGAYYLKISNGAQIFYSEEFVMTEQIDEFIKVEFCHTEDFPLPGGYHIDYRFNYRNFLFFRTFIGKPEYVFENKAEARDGFNFYEQQVRFKRSRFEVFLPEEIADIVSMIGLHDTVKIHQGGKVHECDEFEMSANWLERGDVAAVECEFKTDTVIVVNGKGIATADACGEDTGGGCFDVTYFAVAFIVEDSAEWTGFYYVDQYGNQVDLVAGDLVVVEERPSGDIVLYEYNGVTLLPHPTSPGEYAFDQNAGVYYYDNNEASLLYAHITEITGTHVDGQAIPISSVELWALLANGSEVLLLVTDSFEFTEFGVDFTPPATPIVALKIKASSPQCEYYYDGPWIYLDPFGLITCAANYTDDTEALGAGLDPGDFYCLDIDNPYGMLQALVKRLDPFTGYTSDAAAVASLGRNVVYQMSASNDIGVPSGICRIAVDVIPVYDSDTAAATGGVAVGEFYAYNPAGETAENYCFVKKRQA